MLEKTITHSRLDNYIVSIFALIFLISCSNTICLAAPEPIHRSLKAYPGAVISATDPRTKMIYYVESDGRHIAAIRPDGEVEWLVEAVKEKMIKHVVGTPVIRQIVVTNRSLRTVYGKHSIAEYELKSGELINESSD